MIYWIYLGLAILTEVTGTLSMQYSNLHGGMTGYGLMFVLIICSYFMLSKAVEKIALGVAYALWEAIGGVIITAFSVMLFDEPLSPMKALGLTVLIFGITLLKSGAEEPEDAVVKPVNIKQGHPHTVKSEKEEHYATA